MATPELEDRRPHGHMRAAIRRALAACADIVVPPSCLVCRTPLEQHHVLCAPCWREVYFIRAPLCDVLGIPLPFDTGERTVSAGALARPPAYDRARAVAHFSGSMRTLVHQLKYADRHDARALFGRWLAEAGRELLAGADLVVPVPLTRWRLLSRRFNQAAILAQELSRQAGLRLDPHLLRRTRFTKTQVGLTHDQRTGDPVSQDQGTGTGPEPRRKMPALVRAGARKLRSGCGWLLYHHAIIITPM